ncbi:hypothetical protein GCM10027082_24100 [Comamonas humi]
MSEATHAIWRAGFKNIEAMETDEHVAAEIRVFCGNGAFTKRISRLIAEAGNAHETTGLTPRQLVEQVAMLREVVQSLLYWDNGKSEYEQARAALAATEVKK